MFDLRGWEYTQQDNSNDSAHVLGFIWDKREDTSSINQDCISIEDVLSRPVTKRVMLSAAQCIFDPIGYTCPVTLLPKLLLQNSWEKKLGWDTPVDDVTEKIFKSWVREWPHLLTIKIPRWIKASHGYSEQFTLHMFCDASRRLLRRCFSEGHL